jgi:pentatricopeptide repeat protein
MRDNRVSDAVELSEEMETNGVKLDTYSYNALIKGFVDGGNLEEAKRCHGMMRENG